MNGRQKSSIGGFTLTEMLVAVAIGATVLTGVTMHSVLLAGRSSSAALLFNRETLITSIQANASMRSTLRNSLNRPGNELFTKCVLGGGCTTFLTSEFFPVTLYPNLDNETITGPGWPSPEQPAPKWYDVNNAPCVQGTNRCVLGVETAFRAQCPPLATNPPTINPAATCNSAAAVIQVLFKVTYIGNPSLGVQNETFRKIAAPVLVSELTGP